MVRKKKSPLIIFSICLFSASIILFAITYFLPRKIVIISIEGTGRGGGGCGNIPHYDSQGHSHEPVQLYEGPAPLYRLDDKTTGQVWPECTYKANISPTIVTLYGETYYPIQVTSSLPSSWIRAGESSILSTTVEILSEYRWSEEGYIYHIPWQSNEQTTVTLSVDAPNFDLSPKEETQPADLSLWQPAHQQWIIAPKQNASGMQVIRVNVNKFGSPMNNWFADIKLEVRPVFGINTKALGIIVAVGGAILWILDFVIKIFDVKEKLIQTKSIRKKKSKTRGKK